MKPYFYIFHSSFIITTTTTMIWLIDKLRYFFESFRYIYCVIWNKNLSNYHQSMNEWMWYGCEMWFYNRFMYSEIYSIQFKWIHLHHRFVCLLWPNVPNICCCCCYSSLFGSKKSYFFLSSTTTICLTSLTESLPSKNMIRLAAFYRTP